MDTVGKKSNEKKDSSKEPVLDQKTIIEKQKAEIEELKALKPKNSDDIAPGIRKQGTFEGSYRNGYEDGTVDRAVQAQKEKQSKEMQVES